MKLLLLYVLLVLALVFVLLVQPSARNRALLQVRGAGQRCGAAFPLQLAYAIALPAVVLATVASLARGVLAVVLARRRTAPLRPPLATTGAPWAGNSARPPSHQPKRSLFHSCLRLPHLA